MTDNSPPQVLKERYRLSQPLGAGGQGMVYLAHDEMLQRDVAIKLLPLSQLATGEESERMTREARAIARLSHPNIMALFDMGREGAWHYLVLEYIDGVNLHQWMSQRKGPPTLAETLAIVDAVLRALDYAHARDLIHRDIKPENILITRDEQIKLADFGLALARGDVRLTADDRVVGTALYMAPEMAMGGNFDQRADLYALGAVFYELLTGQPPYSGSTPIQVLTQALNQPLTPPRRLNPGIPQALEQIVIRLLAKNPDERYASAGEVLAALPPMQTLETWMDEEQQRRTSERLSRTLLERIVRRSSAVLPLVDETSDAEDTLIPVSAAGEPEPMAQALLIYAAQEDTAEAIEAERRNLARALQETVISQLNLMLSQANAYEQTIAHPQARMAISVLTTLIRQVLQQTRDLETRLHPTILESLGLEPALEALASQEMRARGLRIGLSLQRLRERLPSAIEWALFRIAQEAIDRAVRQAHASQIAIRLEKQDEMLFFSVADDGLAPTGDILRAAGQRIEAMGGLVEWATSRYGGLDFIIRITLEPHIQLTERELAVIQLVAQGLTNKEIAAMLYVSPRTVKFHLDNIYSKLGIHSRTEAAIYALRRGWAKAAYPQTD